MRKFQVTTDENFGAIGELIAPIDADHAYNYLSLSVITLQFAEGESQRLCFFPQDVEEVDPDATLTSATKWGIRKEGRNLKNPATVAALRLNPADLIARYKTGVGLLRLAEHFDVSDYAIEKLLNENKVVIRNGAEQNRMNAKLRMRKKRRAKRTKKK